LVKKQPITSLEDERRLFFESLRLPTYFVVFIWLIHISQRLLETDLGWWGIYPRESFGLRGVLFAPLLHADFSHLASNSLPFLVLTTLIIYFYPRVAIPTFLILYFVTGLLVWLVARTGVFHIGLSYVVYGLASFVFWTGVFRRSIRSIVLALLVTVLYSGMVEGVLPTPEILQKNISWESHLLGVLVGLVAAYFFQEDFEEDELDDTNEPSQLKQPFFSADIFDKTKEQRAIEAYLAELEREKQKREAYERQIEQQKRLPGFDDWVSNIT
jgi:membrane associated rhomboid family serine protease